MGGITMTQGKGSQQHNRRDFDKYRDGVPDNIHVEKSVENVVLVDKDLKEFYKDFFKDSVKIYNAKQKRNDRKISSYYDHLQKSKNGEKLFYEDVVQWGSKEDFQNNPQNADKAKSALLEYANTFEQRNPNLKLVGAYIHMDEASPHLHLDYVPIAYGYKTGMDTRNSLERAFNQMGFKAEKTNNRNNGLTMWRQHERAFFKELCLERGLEVDREHSARGSLSVREYALAKDKMLGGLSEEKKMLADAVKTLKRDQAALEQQISFTKQQIADMDKVTEFLKSPDRARFHPINIDEPEERRFGKIIRESRQGVFVSGLSAKDFKNMVERIKCFDGIEDSLKRAQKQANKEAKKIIESAKEEVDFARRVQLKRNLFEEKVKEMESIVAKIQFVGDNMAQWGYLTAYEEQKKITDKLQDRYPKIYEEITRDEPTFEQQIQRIREEIDEREL